MSKKQHHSKSAEHHHDRSKHDAAARHEAEDVYSAKQPPWLRYVFIGLATIVVVSLTLLFVGGFIRW